MPARLEVAVGTTFGRLTVLGEGPPLNERNRLVRRMSVTCSCGTVKYVRLRALVTQTTVSCGCYHKEMVGDTFRTHGQSSTSLYAVWSGMIGRCHRPTDPSFENYGGRGIHVSPDWRTFEPFYQWAMAHGYAPGLWIEREDNDKGYSPSNCTWATPKQQANNRRPRRTL